MEVQQQERYEKIKKSKWNRWYKKVRTIGLSRYLKERGEEGKIIRVARFRIENEMREGRYWEREDRRCRLCE